MTGSPDGGPVFNQREDSMTDTATIRGKIDRISRWAAYIADDLKGDTYMVEQLAHEALTLLAGPGALHSHEELKTEEFKKEVLERLSKGIRNASSA